MMNALFIFLQKAAPQHILSRIAGKIAESNLSWLKNYLIRLFVRRYKVDMSEAEFESAESYQNFNAFFTRALHSGARSICAGSASIACPADGAISQIGKISAGKIFQAKGHDYDVETLLGGDSSLANLFAEGQFATIYLSPRDYHRVHMPMDAILQEMHYVPGDLFSVNTLTSEHIPGLFARNERMIAIFKTEFGPMAVVMVGAMIVASIETVWAGSLSSSGKKIIHNSYTKNDKIELQKGSELGRFKLGSTVILLFPENFLEWESTLEAGSSVQMGQLVANLKY